MNNIDKIITNLKEQNDQLVIIRDRLQSLLEEVETTFNDVYDSVDTIQNVIDRLSETR